MHVNWPRIGFKGEHTDGARHGGHGNRPLASKLSSFVQSLSSAKEIWRTVNATL